MNNKRIAIVENELYTIEAISILLQDCNYDIAGTFTSGEELLENLGKIHADLILMDIKLHDNDGLEGVKLDGIETAEIVKNKYDIPVVYLTAHSDDEIIGKAKKTEPFGYIIKPVSNKNDFIPVVEIALYNSEIKKKIIINGKKYQKIEKFIQSTDKSGTLTDLDEIDEIRMKEVLNSPEINFNSPKFINWLTALGRIERLTIVKTIEKRTASFEEIQFALNKAKSTVSHHLQNLMQSNIIVGLRQGKQTKYSLNPNKYLIRFLEKTEISDLAQDFSALGNIDRMFMLDLLNQNPRSLEDMEKKIKKSTSAISYNLRILQKSNFIYAQKQGRTTIFVLNRLKIDNFYKAFLNSQVNFS